MIAAADGVQLPHYRMRVAFLALQAPGFSPGQRYRVEAFLPALARRGITVRYDWLLDRQDLAVFYGRDGAWRKGTIAATAALRRLASVLRAPGIDAFFVQREAFFLGGAWSEALAAAQAPLVYDFDDAIWIRTLSEANRAYTWLKNVDKMPRLVALARTVIAGNDYLAHWARGQTDDPAKVHVVPTCIDTDAYAPPPRRDHAGPITIGWSGSRSTLAHYRALLPVLERVAARLGDRVRFRVMGDPTFEHPPLGLRGEIWSPEAERALLSEMQIGVMPLPDDVWTRGKCGFKGLLSMAMGAATVMSPVGVNTEIVRHGENGLLAADDDAWVEALCTLVLDADLRARLGRAGRETVVERYSVARWEATLARLIAG